MNLTKVHIKRDYKLNAKLSFESWVDLLKSELINNDLLDVIDEKSENENVYSEAHNLKRQSLVRDIIINHLDGNYDKRMIDLKDPKEIIKRLKNIKKSKTNVTHSSVRAKLYQITMKKNEKVAEFNERFNSIVREYHSMKEAVPLTQQEFRAAYYRAT